jgi:hypothetical protein
MTSVSDVTVLVKKKLSWLTCNIWLASNAVPGSKMTGLDTWPDSTQTMLGNSSAPKSEISFPFSTHGFHTTRKKYYSVQIMRDEFQYQHLVYHHNIAEHVLADCNNQPTMACLMFRKYYMS